MQMASNTGELELGLYHSGNGVVVYVNQSGLCIFRDFVELVPELTRGEPVSLALLRAIGDRVIGINHNQKQGA